MNACDPCPYCHRQPEYVDSKLVYLRSYGMIYYCRQCQAWVGVHHGTNKALGTLANATLRKARQRVHAVFDPLWQGQGNKVRNSLYERLAEAMDIPRRECHIAMMDLFDCARVLAICKKWKK